MLFPRITEIISKLSLIAELILSRNALAQQKESVMAQHTSYRTVQAVGLNIFYREAGPKDAPTLVLLLHGLPSSSRMFEPLLTRLAAEPMGTQVSGVSAMINDTFTAGGKDVAL
jgi:hypothetical protein